MYHTAIVKAVLDSPSDFEEGISGVVLDNEHTFVLASDHDDLDAFVADYETVSSHPGTSEVRAWIGRENSPKDSHN